MWKPDQIGKQIPRYTRLFVHQKLHKRATLNFYAALRIVMIAHVNKYYSQDRGGDIEGAGGA